MESLSLGVFEQRHHLIRSWLERESYQALVVLEPENAFYLSGLLLEEMTWERPLAVVIPVGAEPFFVMNEISTHRVRLAKERGKLAITETFFWREHPASTNRYYTYPQWVQLIADLLKRGGIDRGVIACDTKPDAIRDLVKYLPKIEMTAEPDLLLQMRRVKCKEEQDLVRHAGILTDYGQEVFRTLVAPGKLVQEVDFEAIKQMHIKGAELFPKAHITCRGYSLTGPASAAPHGMGMDSHERMQAGHVVVNILTARINGYTCENERTWILGEPSQDQAKAFQAALSANQAALAELRPGNAISSVDAAAQRIIESAGYGNNIRHRTGHPLGIGAHEHPFDVGFNHGPLLEGELWAIEPGIYIYGLGGFRIDDTALVGSDGPEVITTTPRDLESQTIRL